MNRFTNQLKLRRTLGVGVAALVLAAVTPFWAQEPVGNNPEPVDTTPAQQPLTANQLDDLVAPIALYPDPLLGQVLAASTYPLEIVEAQQWLQSHRNLTGQQLTDAARQQNWDASVQALVAFPDALSRLSQNVQWTTALGNAFLAQQADVMGAVQRLRSRAQANGKLQSGPQERVTTQTQDGQQAIAIEPADPQVIYVPQYDPEYIWGPPVWGYYPPLYYPSFGFGWGPGIDIGLCFGGWGGYGFGGWGGWGWGPNWFGHGLYVNTAFFNRYGYRGYGGGFAAGYGRGLWAHDPGHRLGVSYSNAHLANRYQGASMAGRVNHGSQWGGAQGYRGSAYQGRQAFQGGADRQGFQNRAAEGYRNAAPQQRGGQNVQPGVRQNSGGRENVQPGRQNYQSAPRQNFQAAPQQRYSAPQQQRSSAPQQQHFSAPSGGGSAPRSFGGGGGGSHSGGGGGSHSGGGGGSHGGRR